jgi:protein SCO1/2
MSEHNSQPRNLRLPFALILALFSLGMAGVFIYQNLKPAELKTLPVYGTVSEFSFIERSGQPFHSERLQQQFWIADFIFTTCQAECPVMNAEMTRIQTHYAQEKRLKLVSFSVDPETDTPAVLKSYAEKFAADPNRWFFLTGDRQKLHQLATESFKLAVQELGNKHNHHNNAKQNTPGPFLHSQKLVLVDDKFRIRGYYDGTQRNEVERLIQQDLPRLLNP